MIMSLLMVCCSYSHQPPLLHVLWTKASLCSGMGTWH